MKLCYVNKTSNFGDMLSPVIVDYMIRTYNIQSLSTERVPYSCQGKLMAVGSIFKALKSNDVVWGSGSMYNEPIVIPNNTKILAVRGWLTRGLIQGDCPQVFGDPALLMPKIYNPTVQKEYKIGVIPHYIDYPLFNIRSNKINLIDVINPNPLKVIDEMLKCEVIISTSLHGLIVADAYNIPCVWLKVSDNLKGGNFKFYDYFSSIGRVGSPIVAKKRIENSDIFSFTEHILPPPHIDTKPLEQAFVDYFGGDCRC